MKTNNLDKNEIIRFVITGLLAAIIDFSLSALTSFLVQKIGLSADSIWCTVIATAVGFIVSVLFNYVLSIKWVYQNFDKKTMQEHQKTHMIAFFVLSAIGLFIGIGIMAIFKTCLLNLASINIDTWLNVDLGNNLSFFKKIGVWIVKILSNPAFWLFGVAFVVKTLVVLFYNYATRKKFLFKKSNQ